MNLVLMLEVYSPAVVAGGGSQSLCGVPRTRFARENEAEPNIDASAAGRDTCGECKRRTAGAAAKWIVEAPSRSASRTLSYKLTG